MGLIRVRGLKCPMCGGKLGMALDRDKWGLRCKAFNCRHRQGVLHNHPIFHDGRRAHPLHMQCKMLHCILAKLTASSMRAVLGTVNHKAVTYIRDSLRHHLRQYTEKVQADMSFQDDNAEMIELNADEISVGKRGVVGRPDRV
eukprot:155520-Amphidinium_carterae.1